MKIGPEEDIRGRIIELLDAMEQPASQDHRIADR